MELDQLRALEERYSVLKDSSRFMFNTDVGMTLSSEIIDYEFASAFNDIGLNVKRVRSPSSIQESLLSARWIFRPVAIHRCDRDGISCDGEC